MELENIFEHYALTRDQYREFKDLFTLRQFNAGETVFQEGVPSDRFYFVESGELAVSQFSASRQEKVLNVLQPGEFFGEIGLLNDSPRTATIKALTDARLYLLDKVDFFRLLEKNSSFAIFVEQVHVQRLLHGVPLFSHLDDEALTRVRQALEEHRGEAGDVLVKEGDNARDLYLLVKGSARRLTPEPGGRTVPVGHLHAGSHFGEQSLLHRQRQDSSVVLDEPSRLLVLKQSRFRELLRRHPQIAFGLPGSGVLDKLLPFFYNKQAYLAVPNFAMHRPRAVLRAIALITLMLTVAAVVPSLWPGSLPYLHGLKVDTDPENMLSQDQPARAFHRRMKAEMTLHDMLVLGVVNETHPNGVFNVASLARVHQLTEYAKTLQWPDQEHPGAVKGVRTVDIMAPSTVDVVEQAGPGTVSFSWLMPTPPRTEEQAQDVYRTLKRFPMMDGTLISDDGRAMSLYLPLTSKDVSFKVYQALQERIAQFEGEDRFFITGLPVAEDAFGVEMFYQMAISAPLAMLVIFLLMYLFFRNLILIGAPMVLAMVAVMCTMALLVVTGNTLHIMSSMIPIFIMPIAVLDSVHILSEFSDYYPRIRDRRLTMAHVMRALFAPMLFTSITTAVGFASLALVPIPPVQVFGLFVAFGVILAWLLSISLIPAYVLLIPQHKLDTLASAGQVSIEPPADRLDSLLNGLRRQILGHSKGILIIALALVLLCAYGVRQIVVNDNPVRWFTPDHPIRVADRVLNEHFAGTYMAFLALEAETAGDDMSILLDDLNSHIGRLVAEAPDHQAAGNGLLEFARRAAARTQEASTLLEQLEERVDEALESAPDIELEFWEDILVHLEERQERDQVFKDPAVLAYLEELQQALLTTGIVGKSVSVADIAKTINRELLGGADKDYRLPQTSRGVAQTLLTYQSGHRPQDLWRFVTPNYRKASIWLLLNSGDNRDMAEVVGTVAQFMESNPPPVALKSGWFGLTHINVVWQEKMVSGMLFALASSYLAVLLLMTLLLRSAWWGLLSMVPLTGTLLAIYGILGLAGKPYDMPVAVLSALTIGLAVDFTIHFLVRIRSFHSRTRSWDKSIRHMFTEPARAIIRNILVVAIGFLPLLAAPLVPYNTVGTLIAAILFTSGIATLFVITAALHTWRSRFFPLLDSRRTTRFGCGDAIFTTAVVLALLALTLTPNLGWGWLLLISLPALLLIAMFLRWGRCLITGVEPQSQTVS